MSEQRSQLNQPGSIPALTADTELLGFNAFSDVLAQSLVPLDLHCDDQQSFSARLSTVADAGVHLLGIASSAQSVNRTPATIARAGQSCYKFTVIEEGQGLLVHEGRETLLRAGDLSIYDTDKPYSLLFGGGVRVTVLMIPKETLELPAATVASIAGRRLSGQTGVGAVARQYLSALVQQAHDIDPRTRHRLMRSAVDLVTDVLLPHLVTDQDRTLTMRATVIDYIEQHLSDPDLAPASIAAHHFMSLRQLYSLFEGSGVNVAGLIRVRRLERCHDELADPRRADKSAATIARENGFADSAHFSRAFRAQFDVSPSSIRPQQGLVRNSSR